MRRHGFTLFELMIVLAIVAIIAGIAVPSLMRSKMSSNERAAVEVLRQVVCAESTYRNRHGVHGALSDLGREHLVDDSVAAGRKSGYFFGRVDDGSSGEAYCFGAVPAKDGSTGQKEFCVAQEGTVYQTDVDSDAMRGYRGGVDWSNGCGGRLPGQFVAKPKDSRRWTAVRE